MPPSCERVKLLLAGHFGHPWGGISTFHESLLHSELVGTMDVATVETSPGSCAFSQRGKWGVRSIVAAVTGLVNFTWALGRFRPRIIHLSTAHGLSFLKHGFMVLVARCSPARVVLQLHCGRDALMRRDDERLAGRLFRAYVRFVLRRCHAVLVLSREWLAPGFGSPAGRVYLVHNAVDLAPFDGLRTEEESEAGDEPVQGLLLGHIGREKGVMDVIQAIKLLQDREPAVAFQAHFVGEGSTDQDASAARELVRELGLEQWIQFHPPVFGDEKLKWFARADVFLLASYSEGMPMTIIEAMGAALPVIATRVGAIPEMVIDGETGVLIEPGSPDQLARAILSLSVDQKLRRRMGTAGRQVALERYRIQTAAKKLLQIYRQVLVESGDGEVGEAQNAGRV